jgi:hypothetical protein
MAVWNCGCADGGEVCHSRRPVLASNAVTMLVMPKVKRRPLANVGVDFGPAPWRAVAGTMLNAAG